MSQYIRHAVVPVENIISAMQRGGTKHEYSGFKFNISSLRLRTFYRDHKRGCLKCTGCGLVAKFFAVESFTRNRDNNSVHVNLYGVKDRKEVLFTHDHILARALGGSDTLENSQTMCGPCNWAKGTREGHEIKQRRFMASPSPNAQDKMAHVPLKQENPTSISDLEQQLQFWAASKDLGSFTVRLDSWLYKHGWKRKRLKQEIVAGNIKFDLFPVRD